MKDVDGRRQHRWLAWGANFRLSRRPFRIEGPALLASAVEGAGGPSSGPIAEATAPAAGRDPQALRARIGASAFAFRGYDQTNLGRTPELLEHPAYGPVVREALVEASAICADAIHEPVDLVADVRSRNEPGLRRFAHEVTLIVAVEMAQLRLLEQFHDVPIREARLSFGYSIGELSALVLGGVYRLDQLLPVPLELAADCAELAADTSLGIIFTRRGPALDTEDLERLCIAVSSEGRGLVGPSAYLSPNTALVLGQGGTLERLGAILYDFLPETVHLRRNPNHWPPLHTPLVRLRNVPNRAASLLYRIEGGTAPPTPPIISCVTGARSYDEVNSRELLVAWTDRPQRLWDAIDGSLAAGVETVLHVGPAPNLIPSTFERLSNNINKHLGNWYLQQLGRGFVSGMNRFAWLASLLPSQASLLRAPFLEHIILEDWLLEQPVA